MHRIKLTPFQKIFINEWQIDHNRTDYNIVLDQFLYGELNINRLKIAINNFVNKHVLFNSCIEITNGEPFWIESQCSIELEVFDSPLAENEISECINRPFNLTNEKLYRFFLIKYEKNKYRFIFVLHHLLISTLSAESSITNGLISSYNTNTVNTEYSYNEQVSLLKSLADKLTKLINHNLKQSKEFWQSKLNNLEALNLKFLSLETQVKQDKSVKPIIREYRFEFNYQALTQTNHIARKYRITPYLFGQTIFAYLLYRYTGQQQFAISYPFAIKEANDLIYGAQINTSFMVYNFDNPKYLSDIVYQVKNFIAEVKNKKHFDYRYCPVSEIIDISNKDLLDVAFIQTNLKNIIFKFNSIKSVEINHDLNIDLTNKLLFEQEIKDKKIQFRVKYRTDKIDTNLLTNFIDCYRRLYIKILEDECNNDIQSLSQYSILNTNDYHRILYEWNNTAHPYPAHKTIHQLFEDQVNKTPNNIAVIFENKQLTYKELNNKSNQLAHYLRNRFDIHPDELIGICLEKSEYLIIAILGILKSGAAYVPIDPGYPSKRIEYILDEIQAKAIITTVAQGVKLNSIISPLNQSGICNPITTIALDAKNIIKILAHENAINLKYITTSEHLAYVIYTSGSTGTPKGVMIEHKNLVSFISGFVNFPLHNMVSRNVLSLTNYVFDIFELEVLLPLLSGYTLHLFDILNPKAKIRLTDYDCLQLTPSMLKLLIDNIDYQANKVKKLHNLKILIGGEVVSQATVKQLLELENKCIYNKINIHLEIIKVYGPTETTIWSVAGNVDNKNLSEANKLGSPLTNQQIYILDSNLNPMPVGAIGEIYIGGAGVARGYINNPDLTSEKFIANPFVPKSDKKQEILYKTGDLGRWHPDGTIEFIGRRDFQIKLYGHRIEITEIETRLNSYPEIKQSAIVLVQAEKNERLLIGYYTANKQLPEEDIKHYLSEYLPNFMQPNKIIYLPEFPLTTSSKIDRNKLSGYNVNFLIKNNYVEPRNKLEKIVCKVFTEILGLSVNHVGIHDDFFKLGGNSLLAVKAASKLKQVFNLNVEVADIFKYKTPIQLVINVNFFRKTELGPVSSNNSMVKTTLLSFAQERLWVITKYQNCGSTYNVPFIFRLKKGYSIDILINSLKAVINRHEVLKTIIKEDQFGNTFPKILSANIDIDIKSLATKTSLHNFLQQDIGYIFNLNRELPVKIACYIFKDEYYISLIVHHIAFDGWSGEILIHDLIKYYKYHNQNRSKNLVNLPEIPIKYQDFAIWQRNYLKTQAIKEQLIFWEKKLNNYEQLNLPIDKHRPTVFDYMGSVLEFELPVGLSHNLRICAKDLGVSLYSLMLSGFYLLLRIYSNQDDVVLGTIVSNRHYKNVENVVGFFVNALVLRQQINSTSKIIDFINIVFNEVIEAQQNQDIPFEKLVDKLEINKDLSRHPIFQVVFSVQNFGNAYKELFSEYKFKDMHKTAKFDLSLIFDDSNEKLKGKLEYATSLFELNTIKGYINTYKVILQQLIKIKDKKFRNRQIRDLYYLDKATYQKVIIDYNNTYREYETNKTIHQLFEEQVEKTPDNIAVVFEDKKLTYHELNCKSNQLAHYIKRQYNICPNDLIALLINRNENMVIAILAVLKSGGAYVPIDPEYPDSRINYILEDIMPKIIIINISHHNRLSNITNNYYKQASVLPLDKIDFQPILTSEPINNLSSTSTGVDLAYVIYTSGTTGYPKGVKIKHYNLINTVHCLNNIYNLDVECRVSAFCSYVFDVSLIEIFTPLTIGASVYVISDQLKTDIFALSTYILANKINCVYLPPLLLTLLPKIDYPNLKKIIYAGEPCNKETGIYWSNYLQLFNYYGPTETTIFSIGKQVINGDVNLIGKPLNNYKIYILGKDLEPVPIGAFGELYIGGIGVAEEYLNRPELTAQKFILNPFQIIQEKSVIKYNKLYKTGDIVRYSSNNDLEYIGRTDSQVKIRGYRIELKEIENLLNRYKGIKQCIVTLTYSDNLSIKNENKNIVAYYIKDHKINLSSTVYVINNWKKIYNLTYSQTQQDNFKNNFIGWNSSYTGKPISLGQMQEWHNETINKINQLPTQRILEIGTGSGLLLYKLIKQCIFYYAFDVSEHAINYNQKNIDDLGYSNKFQAFAVSADKIGFNTFYKNYDTVILNSVIQYFPSLEYLENVLTQAIDNIKSPGQIFIGDVRDFRLFECFAYAVINFKKGTVNISDIEYFKLREKELLITPEYFLSLKNKINSISSIELLPKLGSALNEMNCYRYDVILHINKEITTPSWQIKYSQFKKIMNLEHFLKNTIKDQLFIKYPNYRIVKDYISCRHLYGYDCDISTGNLDKLLNIMQLSKIFEQFGYIIKLFLDIKHPLYLNIVAYKNLGVEPKHINIDYSIKRLNKINFANKPMQNIMLLNTQYIEELREYLKSQLPDYMIPQYLIPIDKIPLNASGKLDYDALPKPEFYLSNDYTPPKTRLEKALCKTFSQILNIGENRIGIKDNFFNIGGNSLLAIKLMYQINSQFKHKIPIVDIFTNNTVQSLASYLSSVRQNLNYINNLNNVYDKPNMFMIHPAFAGAEVYVELAREFSKMYSCYGLDNYNLHHDKKIQDIQKLAEQYLDRINYIRKQTNQEDEAYVLLGWSLGGQIALNIANILEQNGKKNIYLILIDSVYPDNKFSKHLSNVVLDQTQLNTFAQRFGFDMRYVNKVKNNFHYDIKLSFQGIKIKLEHSKVLLFKAMKKEAIVFLENYGPLKEYVIKLPYNNVDKAVNPLNIHLVQLQDSDHFNLLEQHKLIYQNTLPFIDNKQISQIDKKL